MTERGSSWPDGKIDDGIIPPESTQGANGEDFFPVGALRVAVIFLSVFRI